MIGTIGRRSIWCGLQFECNVSFSVTHKSVNIKTFGLLKFENILVLVVSYINFNSVRSALKWIQLITFSYIFLLEIKQMPMLYVMEKLLLNYVILNVKLNLPIRNIYRFTDLCIIEKLTLHSSFKPSRMELLLIVLIIAAVTFTFTFHCCE